MHPTNLAESRVDTDSDIGDAKQQAAPETVDDVGRNDVQDIANIYFGGHEQKFGRVGKQAEVRRRWNMRHHTLTQCPAGKERR